MIGLPRWPRVSSLHIKLKFLFLTRKVNILNESELSLRLLSHHHMHHGLVPGRVALHAVTEVSEVDLLHGC